MTRAKLVATKAKRVAPKDQRIPGKMSHRKTTNAAKAASSSVVRASAAIETPTTLSSSSSMVALIAATPADESKIPFHVAVREGKLLVGETNATADRNDWRLGELADRVEPIYGEKTLARFAAEIGQAHCTVKRRRTTYRAWKAIGDPGLPLTSYSVLRALETHPDRARLVRENPAMTKGQATRLMKAHRGDDKPQSKMEKWWSDLELRMGKAQVDEDYLKGDHQLLREVVEPTLLSSLREAGQAWVRLADGLEKLFKPADEESFEADV
jgi:hypothetical protein